MALKVAIEGLSGSGKTTLIDALAAHFRSLGLRVEVIDTDTVEYVSPLREVMSRYPPGHIVRLLLFWALRYEQYNLMRARDPHTDIIFMNRSWEGSTRAYDVYGHRVPARVIRWVGRHIPGHPNLTIFWTSPWRSRASAGTLRRSATRPLRAGFRRGTRFFAGSPAGFGLTQNAIPRTSSAIA